MERDVLQLRNGDLLIEVSRFGGSLVSATYRGIPFLTPTPTAGLASLRLGAEACFPLVPFGNRIEGNAFGCAGQRFSLAPNTTGPLCLHGDGWLAEWDIHSHDDRQVELHYAHRAASSPYVYEAVQNMRLDGDAVTLALTVTNRSVQPLPFGLGFHPFFPRTPGTLIRASAGRFWSERAGHLPDVPGAVPEELDFAAGRPLPGEWINNAYDGWDGAASIEWPEIDLRLRLETRGPFDCFMIYSPDAEADFFCFEPMTHLPNAHNMPTGGGLVALEYGQSLGGSIKLRPTIIGR